jgi:hypothetical protein
VRAVQWVQNRFLGRVPEVKRAHPRWRDFETPVAVGKELTAGTARLLIGSSRSTPMSEWFRYEVPDGVPLPLRRLMLNRPIGGAVPGAFDAAFIELVDDYVTHMGEIVRLVAPLLRPDGQVFLLALNTSWSSQAEHTGRAFAAGLASLVRSKPWLDECHIMSASRFRWRVNGACVNAAAALFQRPTLSFPLHLAMAAILLPVAVITNIASSRRIKPFVSGRIPTSVFVRLQVNLGADSPKGGGRDAPSPAPALRSFDNQPAHGHHRNGGTAR